MRRQVGITLMLFALLFTSLILQSVSASHSVNALVNPKFVPSQRTAQMTEQQATRKVGPEALLQISALLDEKESRTPVQQKIDSQLLYAMKMRKGESIASGVQSLSVDLGVDDAGKVTVDITALVDDPLISLLGAMNVEIVSAFPEYHTLRAKASLDQLETIAGLPQVKGIQPKQEAQYWHTQAPRQSLSSSQAGYWNFNKRASQVQTELQKVLSASALGDNAQQVGSVTSQGDTTHQAFAARGTFNVDGTGIKIGVLSSGVANLSTSQASGDLGPVTILPGQAGSGDEGTAMLEIIHDLAPAAQLYFATAGGGIAAFANNIRGLRSAGCDIILDDVGYFVESPFQDGQTGSIISTNNEGLATQAVNDVVASGALYFSAAANSGNKNDGTSGTWEGNFVNGGTLNLPAGGNVHDFDPTTAISQFDTVTASGLLNLHWSDPLGASNNDYDLFVLDSSGTSVLASSTNIQSGTQDPYEQSIAIEGDRVVVLQKTGAADRYLHLSTNGGQLAFNTEGDTHGHNAASGGFGVAAVCASCVFPSTFSSGNTVETFSSDGPRHIFFNGDGTAITPGNVLASGGTILQKPDFAAADSVSVSGAGGFPTLFIGTSAAAPHAAAIAALVKSANPALTPAQMKAALVSTAIDIEGPGTDRDSGAGIVMPYAALQSLGPPVAGKAFLGFSTVTKSETCCNNDGFVEPGESGNLTISLNNLGLMPATSVNATLTSSTAGVTIVNGNSGYPNLAAANGNGTNATPFSISLDSTLPHNPIANFTLTINYTGGYQASQVFTFPIQFGIELTTNGDFESGDFSGWHMSTAATGGLGTPFEPWSVSRAGAGGFNAYGISTTTPQNGSYNAWNGFDGAGPMEFRMYQDVSIPPGSSLTLFWKDRAQWNYCCGQTKSRTYQVQFRNPATNAVLSIPYVFSTGVESGYHDTGWQLHSSNLSAYAGQTIRIYFLEVIPETYTGPGQIEFDSISISNEPPQPPLPIPSPTPGTASPGLYGGTRAAQLIKLDTNTGAGTLVGSLPGLGSTEIEFNNTNHRAFTQFPDGLFQGQEFDISSGAALGGVISDAASFNGLEWVGSALYATTIGTSHGPSELRTLDPSTGRSTVIGATGINDPIAGLAYNTTSGIMYGLTGGEKGATSSLVTVNLTTGAATVVGSVGFNGGSLEFGSDGNLYAGSTGGTGNLYRINPSTGASTLVGGTGFTNITGLTLVNATSPTPTPTPTPTPPGIRLSAASYSVNEASADATITVTRTGDTSGESVVHYATSDNAGLNNCDVVNTGVASPRCDYEATAGSLRFAPGETSRTIIVPIVNDSYAEGNEGFTITLSDITGGVLDLPRTAVVTIIDNEATNGPNPADQSSYFVRQHYLDFLNREPDASGLQFWTNEIESCGANAACREVKRINVSAAFFVSIEFQQTGYLVERLYKTSFGDAIGNSTVPSQHTLPVAVIRLNEFLGDSQTIAQGVIVNSPGWEQQLENNKVAFISSFVGRQRFTDIYAPLGNGQFVDRLNANAGTPLSPSESNQLVTDLNNSAKTRAQVLRAIAEHPNLVAAESNRAFVLMQFVGYLRRNPNDPPDTDYTGYEFWLNKLNQFKGDYIAAEMVKAFISSTEYRQRFGP
jgi:Calx-beta domain/Subtilase family/Domain of unknown function (DUF4214)